MRLSYVPVAALAAALLVPVVHAQQDPNRKVANGGIQIAGWMARPDADTVNDARLWQEGADIMVSTGPAISYWNPANTASGNYMVKATFTEPKQVSDHPHPFGLFIGGNDLGTDQQTLLYCVAYRNGRVLVRGFSGTNVFTVLRPAANPAVHTADAAVAARDPGDLLDGHERHGRMHDQRHVGGQVRRRADPRRRQAQVARRRLRPPRRAQYRREGVRFEYDEALTRRARPVRCGFSHGQRQARNRTFR